MTHQSHWACIDTPPRRRGYVHVEHGARRLGARRYASRISREGRVVLGPLTIAIEHRLYSSVARVDSGPLTIAWLAT